MIIFSNHRIIRIFQYFLFISVLILNQNHLQAQENQYRYAVPDFTIIDTDGNTMNLYQHLDSGNIVVIDFFTTTCGTCSFYAPVIEYFYQYKADSGTRNIKLWGIEISHTNAQVVAYKIANQITNPCASGLEGNGANVFQLYTSLYGYHGTPSYSVICPSGQIYYNVNYPPTKDGFDIYIRECEINTSVEKTKKVEKYFSLFPNPTKQILYFGLNKNINPTDLTVQIFDMQGRKWLEKYFCYKELHNAQLDVSTLSEGIYQLHIKSADGKIYDFSTFVKD